MKDITCLLTITATASCEEASAVAKMRQLSNQLDVAFPGPAVGRAIQSANPGPIVNPAAGTPAPTCIHETGGIDVGRLACAANAARAEGRPRHRKPARGMVRMEDRRDYPGWNKPAAPPVNAACSTGRSSLGLMWQAFECLGMPALGKLRGGTGPRAPAGERR